MSLAFGISLMSPGAGNAAAQAVADAVIADGGTVTDMDCLAATVALYWQGGFDNTYWLTVIKSQLATDSGTLTSPSCLFQTLQTFNP